MEYLLLSICDKNLFLAIEITLLTRLNHNSSCSMPSNILRSFQFCFRHSKSHYLPHLSSMLTKGVNFCLLGNFTHKLRILWTNGKWLTNSQRIGGVTPPASFTLRLRLLVIYHFEILFLYIHFEIFPRELLKLLFMKILTFTL